MRRGCLARPPHARQAHGTMFEMVRDIARRVKRIEQRLVGDDEARDDESHG